MNTFIQKLSKYLIVTLLGLSFFSITACNFSSNALKESYNDLGSSYVKQLKTLVDYTAEQSVMLDELSENILSWHRENRLPTYSNLIQSTVTKLESSQNLTNDDIRALIKMYWGYPHFYESDAINRQLARIATTLSDKQFIQLTKRININLRRYTDQQNQSTWKDKIEDGLLAQSEFFSAYLDIELSDEQIDILHQYFNYFIDQTTTNISSFTNWNETLISLLEERQQPDFVEKFAKHMQNDNRYKQLLNEAPAETEQHDQVVVNMHTELFASLSEKQKSIFVKKLKSINRALKELMSPKSI